MQPSQVVTEYFTLGEKNVYVAGAHCDRHDRSLPGGWVSDVGNDSGTWKPETIKVGLHGSLCQSIASRKEGANTNLLSTDTLPPSH